MADRDREALEALEIAANTASQEVQEADSTPAVGEPDA